MITLPQAPIGDILARMDQAWQPEVRNNMLVLGTTGAGKTTLIRQILTVLCPGARVVVFLPKVAADSSWTRGQHAPRPVPRLAPGFGASGDGGGPAGRWYLRAAAADTAEATRAFHDDLMLIKSEGHTVVVTDDTRMLAKTFRERRIKIGDDIDDLLTNGRSNFVSTIVANQTASWTPGRGQFQLRLIGSLQGIPEANAARDLMSLRGKDWSDAILGTRLYDWIYSDVLLGATGPCRFTCPPL